MVSYVARLETDLFFQKRQLEFVVGQQRLAIVEEHKGQVQEKVAHAAKERQKKKFDTLVSKQSSQRKPDERHVVNLSSKQLYNHTSAIGSVQGSELCSNS